MCIAGAFRSLGDLLEEVGAKRVRPPPEIAIGFAHELRDEMKVADRREEFCQLPELPIDVHLLQIRLLETIRIPLILRSRALQEQLACFANQLRPQNRSLSVVLSKADFILPLAFASAPTYDDANGSFRVAPSRKTAKPRNAAALCYCLPEAPANRDQVVQKPYRVQEVGFPGGVWTD